MKLETRVFWGVSQADGSRVSAARARADSDPKISAAKVS